MSDRRFDDACQAILKVMKRYFRLGDGIDVEATRDCLIACLAMTMLNDDPEEQDAIVLEALHKLLSANRQFADDLEADVH